MEFKFHSSISSLLKNTNIFVWRKVGDNVMDRILDVFISVMLGVLASSGFWAYITNRRDRKSMQTELLIGLAHDRLISLSLQYIERGSITQDEYENLNVYLYKPYVGVGGNGSVKRLMLEVDKLPIMKEVRTEKPYREIYKEKKEN